MKKQIFILGSIGAVSIGFFFFTRLSSSHSGTLFEAETAVLETDNLDYEGESAASPAETEGLGLTHQEIVFVDVQGEVANPGVFEVNHEARVGYLIMLAGGLTEYATTRGLNQAARIYDEMVIFIPHVDDVNKVTIDEKAYNESHNTAQSDLISLSTASTIELQSLPGIGPVISENIIAHRETNGPFSSIEELLNVGGIGSGIMDNIREFIKP